jgi:hypothetical protein
MNKSYDVGFAAGLNARPRRGQTDAYDRGYDHGISVANEYLAAGFERDCGGFVLPIRAALVVDVAAIEPRWDGEPSGPNAA